MDEIYQRLFRLYKKSPRLFQNTIDKIGEKYFDLNYVVRFLDSKDSDTAEAIRRIILTFFHKELSNTELYNFQACSGDMVTQKMIADILEERIIQKENLRVEAESLVALFTS